MSGEFFCFDFCIVFYGKADKMKCNMIYTAIIWCIEMLINNQAITLFTILIIAQITHTVQSIIRITFTASPSANLLLPAFS